jgi:hypothetical protein
MAFRATAFCCGSIPTGDGRLQIQFPAKLDPQRRAKAF